MINNEISKEIFTIDQGTCIVKKRNYFVAFGGALRTNQIVTISEKGFKECTFLTPAEACFRLVLLYSEKIIFNRNSFISNSFENQDRKYA